MKRRRYYRKRSKTVKLTPVLFVLSVMFVALKEYKLAALTIFLLLCPFLLKNLRKYVKKLKYLKSSLYAIDKMAGTEFEEYLKAHFEQEGYKVTLTPKSGDYGIDLICKKTLKARKDAIPYFVVQAKRYNKKVGVEAVQQVIGGMHYYNCHTGMVVTNSFFTPNARKLADKSGIILLDRNDLKKRFRKRGKEHEKKSIM